MKFNKIHIRMQKKFILLCFVTCLYLYCGLQIFKIEDLKSHIARLKDPNAEALNVGGNLHLIEEEEKEIIGPSLAVQKINYDMYQSNVSAEFPHIVNGPARIPHIIHQIGDTELLPDNFLLSMRSFVEHNPTWEYRFWTYKSGYNFLKKFHPYLVDTYDSFEENDVRKSDMLRFAVIYEYGGLYADVDVSNVRPLNITTTKYACIIPTEPFEHAAMIYRQPFILTTSVFLCRPRHPFFEKVLWQMSLADPKGHPVSTTGPGFVSDMYIQYNNITWPLASMSIKDTQSNSPYFYKGTINEESDDGIYIPNSQYFSDNVDPSRINDDGVLKDCLSLNKDLMRFNILNGIKRACKEFDRRKVIRNEKQYTFTIHHWFHWWTKGGKLNNIVQKYNMKEVIPKAITFEE